MTICDTHVHVWDLQKADYPWLKGDTSILHQTWTIGQVEEERKKAGIDTGVLVQASGNLEDTELMFDTAESVDWIKGVVAWLPLLNPGESESLLRERFLHHPYFKGIRHQIHDEKDPKWLLQPAVVQSLKILSAHGIPFDVVAVLPAHIETALKVSEQIPELRMVFDHLAQPPIASKERYGKWGELMKEAAANKNMYAKISGLGTASGDFQNRTQEDVKPYVAFALEQFGVDRCFCGGDWPVSLLAGGYADTWKMYTTILSELLSPADQEKVLYGNAMVFYQLS